MRYDIPAYVKTACSAWGARGVAAGCRLCIVFILLRFLAEKEYAALAILGGLEGWFLLLDFGVGASLQNTLVERRAKGLSDSGLLKTALVLGICSFVVGILFLWGFGTTLTVFFLDKIAFASLEKMRVLLWVNSFFLLMGTFGSLAGKVLLAKQKGFVFYLFQGLASIFSLVVLLVGAFFGEISVLFASCCLFGLPGFISLLCAIWVFSGVSWKEKMCWEIVARAKNFFLFSLLASFVTLSDALIIPLVLQTREIIEYNLLCKIFGVASFFYSAFLQSFWPQCGEYLTLSLFTRVERLIRRFCFIGIIGTGVFTLGVLVFSSVIAHVFMVSLSGAWIVLFGFYLSIRVVADFYAMALQSMSHLRPFFFLVPIQAVLSVGLQYFLSRFLGIGGILLGLSLSYLATVFWALPKEMRLLQKTAQGIV